MTTQQTTLQTLVQDVLQSIVTQGATAAEVAVDTNKGFSVTAREGDVETVEYNQDKSMELTVFFDKRTGSASLSDFSKEAIDAAIHAACHIAKFTDNDPMSGLAEKEMLAFHYPTLDLSHPWALSVEEAMALAVQCEQIAKTHDKRILCAESVGVATTQGMHVYGNSQGFIGGFPYTRHDMSCVLVAKAGEERQRDYYYTVATHPENLESVETVARLAAERTVRRLGARALPTTKAPVLFIAEEARGLLGHFLSAISGGALYRKASFLQNHLGKQIFPSFMHLSERPHLSRALGSAPFDSDGVATRPNVFIDQGILQSYMLDVYTGRQLGMQTTGNAGGAHNVTPTMSDKNLPALLKEMQRGLLVTEIMGNGVNLVTGDYSRGIGGFWVEHGEIQFPVQEVTIAGNLRDMFANLACIGNDIDRRGNVHTGSILLAEMTIAGV